MEELSGELLEALASTLVFEPAGFIMAWYGCTSPGNCTYLMQQME